MSRHKGFHGDPRKRTLADDTITAGRHLNSYVRDSGKILLEFRKVISELNVSDGDKARAMVKLNALLKVMELQKTAAGELIDVLREVTGMGSAADNK